MHKSAKEKERPKKMSAKNWTFTVNNYSDTDEIKISTMFDHGHIQYVVYGREFGIEGTPHLQGYVQFKKKLRLNQVKQMISPKGHYEISRGSPEINREYCSHFTFETNEQVRKMEIFTKRERWFIKEV